MALFKNIFIGTLQAGTILLCLPSTLPAESEQNAVPSALETDSKGWEDITPSADLKGWIRVPVPLTEKLSRDQWHIQNGLLTSDGDGGHDMLLLDRKLKDAIFHLEFRFLPSEGTKGYNSGAYIRNSRDGKIWHQAQIGSLGGGHLFGSTVSGEGSKNFQAETKPNRVKQAGEWNTFELSARGPIISLWVNGFVTAEFTGCGLEAGYLGLESEGYRIEFRNLKLKQLP